MPLRAARLRLPRCRFCWGALEFDEEWYCPRCGFRYQVDRGEVGAPLWGGTPEEERDELGEAAERAFRNYLREAGFTDEDYERLSEEGKRLLFQRWRETVGI